MRLCFVAVKKCFHLFLFFLCSEHFLHPPYSFLTLNFHGFIYFPFVHFKVQFIFVHLVHGIINILHTLINIEIVRIMALFENRSVNAIQNADKLHVELTSKSILVVDFLDIFIHGLNCANTSLGLD